MRDDRTSSSFKDSRGRFVNVKTRKRRLFLEPLENRSLMTMFVSITAIDNQMTEPPPGSSATDLAKLRIQRTSSEHDYSGMTTVYFEEADVPGFLRASGGFASPVLTGSGYAYVSIPPNQQYIDVVLNPPSADFYAQELRMVRVQLRPSDGQYTIDNTNAFDDISVADSGYDGIPDVSIAAIGNLAEPTGSSGYFVVSRNNDSPYAVGDLEVNLEIAGSATGGENGDFIPLPASVTIPAGQNSVQIPVSVRDDNLAEGAEDIQVSIKSGSGYAYAAGATASLVLLDNDQPTLTLSKLIDGAEKSPPQPARFRVGLSAPSLVDITVQYSTANGTATAPEDFSDYAALQPRTLTIPAGSTSATFDVNVVDDSIDEFTETMNATLSNPFNAVLGTAQAVAQILDNDGPTVSISDASVREGWLMEFIVSLSQASVQDVKIDYTTIFGTANSWDFVGMNTSSQLTIAAGQTTKKIQVQTHFDEKFENDETFVVSLNPDSLQNALPGDMTAVGTIVDDDAAPFLNISDLSVREDAYSAALQISLTDSAGAPVYLGKPISFRITSSATTATADDASFFNYIATIYPSDTQVAATSATIYLVNDGLYEGEEVFSVAATELQGVFAGDTTASVTIVDDDAKPTLSIADHTFDEDAGTVTFTVSRSGQTSLPLRVSYSTADGVANSAIQLAPATEPGDYQSTSGTLEFGPNDTTLSVPVTIVDSATDETAEYFYVRLFNEQNATVTDGEAIGTIVDDDGPTVDVVSVSVSEGLPNGPDGKVRVPVRLSQASPEEIRVNYTTRNGTAHAGVAPSGDFTASSGQLVFPPQTTELFVDVPLRSDAADEVDVEQFYVDISVPDTRKATVGTATGTISIADDDALPTLSVNSVSISEAGNALFTITRSGLTERNISFQLTSQASASGTSATPNIDFAAQAFSGTISAGSATATVTVPIIGDQIDETTERFQVVLSSVSNAEGNGVVATADILDDDGPVVTVMGPSDPVAEQDGAIAFHIQLSYASVEPVTVYYETENVSATSGADYQAASGSIVIPASPTVDETQQTYSVDINIVGDLIDEVDEKFKFKILSVAGGSLGLSSVAEATIDDNDGPEISIVDAQVVEGTGTEPTRLSFTLHLSAPSPQEVSVLASTFNTYSDAAVSGEDFTPLIDKLVTFAPGTATASVEVLVSADAIDEAIETFSLQLSQAVDAAIVDGTATGVIEDDDGPRLQISSATAEEGEGVLAFTVTLVDPSSGQPTTSPQDISVHVSTFAAGEHSATSGSDYVAVNNFQQVIPAGSYSGTISVTLLQDALDEFDETLLVTLSPPENATIEAGTSTAVGTIIDDDASPILQVVEQSVDESIGVAHVVVRLVDENNQPVVSGRDVSFTATTIDGTALATSDYISVGALHSIIAGDASTVVNVSIVNDTRAEQDEAFVVKLSAPEYASIDDSDATITILDNELRFGIEAVPGDDTALEGGANGEEVARFRIWFTGQVIAPYTPNYNISWNSALNSDYSLLSIGNIPLFSGYFYPTPEGVWRNHLGESSGSSSMYVSVIAIDDPEVESPEALTLSFFVPPENVYYSFVPGSTSATVTILDNDSSFTVRDDNYSVAEDNVLSVGAAGVAQNDTAPEAFTVSVVNFPAGNLQLNTDGSFQYTPIADFTGIDSFTYRLTGASSGTQSTVATVTINVDAVNDPPSVSSPSNILVDGPSAPESIPLTGEYAISISDIDAGPGSLSLTLTVDYGSLSADSVGAIPAQSHGSQIVVDGTLSEINSFLATLRLHPSLTNSASLQISVNDNGSSPGPAQSSGRHVSIVLTNPDVNEAPQISAPAEVATLEDTPFVFQYTTLISVSDPDSGENPVRVTLKVEHGELTAKFASGVEYTPALNEDQQSVASELTLVGAWSAINSAIAELKYTPEADYFGIDELKIEIDDQGYSTGEAETAEHTVTITITPVNDAPINRLPGSPLKLPRSAEAFELAGLSVTDIDAGTENVSVTISVVAGQITVDGYGPTKTYTFLNRNFEYINSKLGSLEYVPIPYAKYTDTLSLSSNDLGNTGYGGPLGDWDAIDLQVGSAVVGIFASDRDAVEPAVNLAADPGQFTIFRAVFSEATRAEELQDELVVQYEVVLNTNPKPAATFNVDYALINPGANPANPNDRKPAQGTVTIPAGAAEVKLDVWPFLDGFPDPGEIVRVRLIGAAYKTSSGSTSGPGSPNSESDAPSPSSASEANDYYVIPKYRSADVVINDRPTEIMISPTDKYGAEASGGETIDNIQFTVSRGEGNTYGDLSVYLTINDPNYLVSFSDDLYTRALLDVDYNAPILESTNYTIAPGYLADGAYGDNVFKVVIPDGQSAVSIDVFPSNDSINEWDEFISFQIVTSPLVPLSGYGGFPFSYLWPMAQWWPTLSYPNSPYATPGYKTKGSDIASAVLFDNDAVSGLMNRNVDDDSTGLSTGEFIAAGGIAVDVYQGLASVSLPVPGAASPTYRGDDNLRPICPVNWQFPYAQLPEQLAGNVRTGSFSNSFEIALSGASTTDLRFVMPLGDQLKDQASTGQLDYDLQFSAIVNGFTRLRTIRGVTQVINTTTKNLGESAMGAGWGLDEVDRLYPTDGDQVVFRGEGRAPISGMTLIRGDNSSGLFQSQFDSAAVAAPSLATHVSPGDAPNAPHWLPGTAGGAPYFYTSQADQAQWSFDGLQSNRLYQVLVTWTPSAERTSNARYFVEGTPVDSTASGRELTLDQRFTPGDVYFANKRWRSLGFYLTNDATSNSIKLNLSASGNGETVAGEAIIVDSWSFSTPQGSVTQLSTLQPGADSRYLPRTNFVLAGKYGDHYEYDARGLLIRYVDRNGNQTRYQFTDGDQDQLADEVHLITRQGGLITTLNYAGGNLTSIADFSGRTTTYIVSDGNLQAVVLPAVSQGLVGTDAGLNFGYGDTKGLLVSYSDSNGNTSTVHYASGEYRIDIGTNPDTTTWMLDAYLTDGLPSSGVPAGIRKSPSGKIGAEELPGTNFKESRAKYRDPRSVADTPYFWTYQFDAYGLKTAKSAPATEDNPQEDVWLWSRRPDGLTAAFSEPKGGGGATRIDERLVTAFGYDGRLNQNQVDYPNGTTEKWWFGNFSELSLHQSPGGFVTSYLPDERGNALEVTENPLNFGGTANIARMRTTAFAYTARPNDINAIPGGLVWRQAIAHGTADEVITETVYYDTAGETWIGLPQTIKTAVGTNEQSQTAYTYDTRRNPLTLTNEELQTTDFVYNERNWLVKTELPAPSAGADRPKSINTYDPKGNLRFVEDVLGQVSETFYDSMDRVYWSKLPVAGGSPQSDQNRATTFFHYTQLGQLRSEQAADGSIIDFSYDARGNRKSKALPSPNYSLDKLNSVPGAAELNQPSVTLYAYDAHGNLKSQSDPRPSFSGELYQTSYSYDRLGRQTLTTYPSVGGQSGKTRKVYGDDGELNAVEVWGPEGWRTTTYAYDGLRALARVSSPADHYGQIEQIEYGYDLRDNRTLERQVNSNVEVVTSYDRHNRPTKVTSPAPDAWTAGLVVETHYRADGAVDWVSQYPEGGSPEPRKVTYELDHLGRVKKKFGVDADGNGPLSRPITTFEYNAAGQVVWQEIRYAESGPGSAITREFHYDNLGRLWRTLDAEVQLMNPEFTSPTVDRPETIISYDIMGREVRRKVKNNDAANNVQWIETVTAYDARGRQNSVNGPYVIGSTGAAPVSFTFLDQLGNTRFEVDPRDAITEYQYDGLGRLQKTIAPPDRNGLRATTQRFFNVAGDVTSERLNDRETFFSVDARGRTFQVSEPAVNGTSPLTTFVYDALGAVRTEQRPHGNTTTTDYDKLHRVAAVSRPNAGSVQGVATTSQRRDPFGNVTRTTNEFDAVSTFERNNIDQVTESTRDVPANSNVAPPRILHTSEAALSPEFIAQDASEFPFYASTSGGVVMWTITGLKANVNYKVNVTWDTQSGNTTAARYTFLGAGDVAIGQPLLVDQTKAPNEVFADGFSWRTLHILSTSDGTAKIRLNSAAPGRISVGHLRLTELTEVGGTTENRYYPTGLLNWTRDSQGHKTSYTYDALGRTSFVEDAAGQRTYFGYDLLGRQTSVKDPNGNITVFKYDARGNKTEELRFLPGQTIPTQTRRFKYDLNDNLEFAQDALGRVRTYAYDNLNRQWQETWFAGPAAAQAGQNPLKTIVYDFDAYGRLKSAGDDGSLYQYDYDNLDRLTSEFASVGGLAPIVTLETEYPTRQDAQRQALWTLLNGVLDNTIEFQYDEQLRLKSLRQSGAGETAAVRDKFVTFRYDADGRFESIARYQDYSDSSPLSLVFGTNYDYDGRGQLTALTHFKSTLSNLAKYVYSYDSEGRIIGISSNDGAALYSYTSNGRLSEENYNFGSTVALSSIRHGYDAAGNSLFKDSQGATVDTASQPGDFNRIESDGAYTYEYDAEGNRTAKTRIFDGARTEYDWDHRNRLIRVRELGVGSGSGSASGSLGGSAFISGSGSAATPQLNLYSSGSGGGVYSFVSTQGEGNQGSINFWATQTLQEPIDVEYWSEDGTAANYEDYILPPPSAPGRVTLQPWAPFAYVSFALPDDYEATGTQNFHVKWRVLQSSGSGGGGSASGGNWSYGSAALPGSFYGPASNGGSSLSWDQKYRNASASAGGVTVSTSTAGEDSQLTVYLWKQDYSTPSTIEYWVEDGSAQVNSDFEPVHNTVMLDSANYGWSWNYYALIDDLAAESEESYVLKFRVDGGPVQTLVNTIVDNDQASVNVTMNSTVWISTSVQEEGQPIYLYAGYWSSDYSGGYPFPVTVQFTVTDALGQPSGDVTTPSFSVTFAPYEFNRYVTLPTSDDSLVEGVETLHFHAQLVAPHSGAVDFSLQLADNDFGLPLTSGLLGQWEFNNDTLDSSGFGRHLTSSDATYRVGVTGTGLQGTADAPSPSALAGAMTAGDYTTSFWFEVPKSGVNGDLLARHSISGNGWANFSARYGGSGLAYLSFSNSHGTTSSSASGVTSGWHHAAFVRAGGVLTMYLDGMAVGTANGANGSSGFAPQFTYQGVAGIDAAQVWTRALSQSDIAQVFLSPPPLQAVYSLTAAVADDEQPELAYTPTSFYAIVDPTYEGGSLHISAGINVYTGSPVSLEIELVGAPEVLARLPQPTATIVIPAWSTWGDVYLPTLNDNQYQGTLPVEVRVRLAAPSVSEVYTGVVNLGDDESPPSSPAKVVEYTYDYRNRLIGREEDGDREAFVYDGDQVLLRFDDAGDLANRYLWGPGVDLLLTDEQLDTGELLWAAGDHQNSVRDLVTFDSTTHQSQVAAHRVYTAYGSLASETRQAGDATAAAVDTLFGYTGRYFDDAVRLQNNLNRWYDPDLKQWASEDPKGFAAGDPNLRRYVSNDPVNKLDPEGLAEHPLSGIRYAGLSRPANPLNWVTGVMQWLFPEDAALFKQSAPITKQAALESFASEMSGDDAMEHKRLQRLIRLADSSGDKQYADLARIAQRHNLAAAVGKHPDHDQFAEMEMILDRNSNQPVSRGLLFAGHVAQHALEIPKRAVYATTGTTKEDLGLGIAIVVGLNHHRRNPLQDPNLPAYELIGDQAADPMNWLIVAEMANAARATGAVSGFDDVSDATKFWQQSLSSRNTLTNADTFVAPSNLRGASAGERLAGAAADSRTVWSSAAGDVVIDGSSLPGGTGMVVPRRLTTTEMAGLQQSHGVEFALIYELGAGRGGGGGRYLLYSGERARVWFPPNGNSIWISHTHPEGYALRASKDDQLWLQLMQRDGSPQKTSTVIPLDGDPFRFNVNQNRLGGN